MMDELKTLTFPTESRPLAKNFLALLPRLTRHARFHFRFWPCPHAKADAIAEAVALAWHWYLRLAERGKDPSLAAAGLIVFAVRAVTSGRRLCGRSKVRDVLSVAHRMWTSNGNRRLGRRLAAVIDFLEEILVDNRKSTVPDQAAFRSDFPAWCETRSRRDRRIIADLMKGERTMDVARKYHLTTSRVSQLRRDLHDDWKRFVGELE
jgi:hypothetical protein